MMPTSLNCKKRLLSLGAFAVFALAAALHPLPAMAEGEADVVVGAEVTPELVTATPAPTKKMSKRARRDMESAQRREALLAQIPENHPMRSELRLIVMQGAPDGYAAEEWLAMSMKVNFRNGPAKHASVDLED